MAGPLLAFGAVTLTGPVDGNLFFLGCQLVTTLAVALAGHGAWRHRRDLGAVGPLVVASLTTGLLGNLLFVWLATTRPDEPVPLWSNALYLCVYPAIATAALIVVRRRTAGRDLAAFIDAATLVTGVAVVAYVFVIADVLGSDDRSVAERVVAALYPLADVLVVGIVARLLVNAGAHRGPVLLLAAGMAALLTGDLGWTLSVYLDVPDAAVRATYGAYLLCYLLCGLALSHPDAQHLLDRVEQPNETLGPARAALLALGGLLAPATLLISDSLAGDPPVRSVAVGAAVLFLLTLLRMLLLVRAVERQREQLEVLARTDALTGLANRRSFDHELRRASRLCCSTGAPLSVALLDLDHFKRFNDSHGHVAGDQLLQEAAASWVEELAVSLPGATLARYGGEEFAVVAAGCEPEETADAVRRLLARSPRGQTFSAGVARWDGRQAPEVLLAVADTQLYAAKEAGRARVLVARQEAAGRSPSLVAAAVPVADRE